MSVITNESSTVVIPTTEIISDNITTEVTTANNRIAEVNTNTYVLQSYRGSEFSGANGLPAWLGTAINDAIVDGIVDLKALINALNTAFDTLETGVHQQISSVQSSILSTSTRLDSNVSRLDGNIAGVIQLTNSKVTKSEAVATALTAVKAEFNTPGTEANSIVVDLINTHADAKGTTATEIDAMLSTFNDINTTTNVLIEANAQNVDNRLTTAGIGADGYLTAGSYSGRTLTGSVGGLKISLDTSEGLTLGTAIYQEQQDSANSSALSLAEDRVTSATTAFTNATENYTNAIEAYENDPTEANAIAAEDAKAALDAADKELKAAKASLEDAKDNKDNTKLRVGMKRFKDASLQEPFVDSNLEVYLGPLVTGDNGHWTTCDTRPWAGGANSLITDPNTGQTTGWGYYMGNGLDSTFKIAAKSFSIVGDGESDAYPPFEINNGAISFIGTVDFNNVDTGLKDGNGNTVIDGGKITTGSLRANQMFSNRLVNIGAYNSDGSINEANVTMDIDLAAGSIYIK